MPASLNNNQLPKLQKQLRERSSDWPKNEIQFNTKSGWANSYTDIFSGQYQYVLAEEQILDTVLSRGRAIITGRGGGGKTWVLRRLYERILNRGHLPVMLDLKQWTAADYETWTDWTAGELGDAAEFLIRRFSGLSLGVIDLDRLPPDLTKILLVDGLNEITSPVGLQILRVLDELARIQINLSVIVADRLIRRDLPVPSRWAIGVLFPLSMEEVRKHLGKKNNVEPDGILTSPFFLDAALKYNVEGPRRSQISEKFLMVHGGLTQDQLDGVAAAAFNAYQRSKSRVFDRREFSAIAGEAATVALETSGTLVSIPDRGRSFVHHILHDYLAARHFALEAVERWTPQALSDLSFDASSFDAIELVFEQLKGDRADFFLRQLYDWNLYAAGYALAQIRDTDVHVSSEIKTMIFAMLAEKRFDTFLATRQKAEDALALMQLPDARIFRDAASLEEIFRAIGDVPSNEDWFSVWRELFRTEPRSELGVPALQSIRNPDSIVGWTVANVARRSVLTQGALVLLIGWVDHALSATVRWRIAHVLGAHPSQDTLHVLFRLLEDPDRSVRYGAIRSIVELAARAAPELRNAALVGIGERKEAISKQPKISGELRTCLLVDPSIVESDWLLFVTGIVREMFVVSENNSERDLWRRSLGEAESLYAVQNRNRENV